MKRLFFVFAILLVMGVVAFYIYAEFSIDPIVYVSDSQNLSSKGNEIMIYRLYAAEVDVEAFMISMEESLLSSEFTEEEITAAAIASGAPKFYPAFFLGLYQPDTTKEVYTFQGTVRQAYAKNQKSADYTFTNITLEITSEGLDINNVDYSIYDEDAESFNVPVISEDKRSMAMNLDNVAAYTLEIGGTSGVLTYRFTFDIITNSIFPNTVLEDQLLIVYANLQRLENNVLQVSYILEPYSSVEEYAEEG